ncbi:hypothetical protein [Nocardioides caricicola]|uniref:DUF2750 domain-containing protein n=1 Tax=Nocardioides caricicola TaxID=634770 RepID=A0ABW0N351_9ACTN
MTTSADPNELDDLLAPYWSTSRTMEALRLTADGLAAAREDGRVLGLKTSDGDYFYPVWTFVKAGENITVKPGVAVVLRALRGLDGWTIGVFLRMGAPELDGLTPEEWIAQQRDLEVLRDYAHVFAAEMRRP